MRDRFSFEMAQAKSDAKRRDPKFDPTLVFEIDKLVKETGTLLNTMISANEEVSKAVFLQDKGDAHEWDDHVRSTLLKKQQITHVKAAIDLKVSQVQKRTTSI